jgi:hypothetical protein
MGTRGLRFLLIATLFAALAALVQDFRFDNWIAREHASAETAGRGQQSAIIALADVRAGQAGYVATGQGPSFWMKRVSDLLASIGTTTERLRASASSAEALAQYDAAASAVDELQKADTRARDFVAGDQRFLASDVIFVDSLEAGQRVAAAIAAAGAAEEAASAARLARLSRWRLTTIVGTLVWGMCVVLVVFGKLSQPAPIPIVESVTPAAEPDEFASPARLLVPRAPIAPPAAVAEPIVNLSEVAELCVDLAKVFDGREVPALLGRTVKVLDAKGLVLWVIDTSGTFLRPWLLHGYPEKVVQRLGSLQVDADNLTSLAFRSMQPQTANSRTPDTFGAVAVPLLTSTGCVGVLSAELRRQRPDRETLSAVRMIAAQLAALATPAGEGTSGKAAQG